MLEADVTMVGRLGNDARGENLMVDLDKGGVNVKYVVKDVKHQTGINPETEEKAVAAAKWLYQESHPQYVILKLGSRRALLYDGVNAEVILVKFGK